MVTISKSLVMFNVKYLSGPLALLSLCTVHCIVTPNIFLFQVYAKRLHITAGQRAECRQKIVFDFVVYCTCSLLHHLYESCFLRTSFVGGGKQWHRQMCSSQAKKCNGILLKKNFEKSFASSLLTATFIVSKDRSSSSSGMLQRHKQKSTRHKTKQGSGVIIPNFSGHATR